MKKAICIVLCIMFCMLCACESHKTESNVFSQEVTIVRLPSPPKCKTSNSVAVVNEVLDVLSLIEKHPKPNETNASGWSTMIRIKVDGQEFIYTLSENLFTDADNKQYNVTNGREIENKITDIYNKLDVPERDYP